MIDSVSIAKYTEFRAPRGGTELMFENLHTHVAADLLERVHISVSATTSRTRRLKPHIFWAHQSYDQPTVQNLKDPYVQATIDHFVFISAWQREQYIRFLNVPAEKSVVIPYALAGVPRHHKPSGPPQLIYTSTPFRGLDVLLAAFAALQHPTAELHVYSGMGLYARPHEDARFQALYAEAKRMPRVQYHGVVPNTVVRDALQRAHIFAYPCTWEETSCLALLEAMSAGCLAVVPELGALPESAQGFAQLYPYHADKDVHARCFREQLEYAIDSLGNPSTTAKLASQVNHYHDQYSWQRRKGEWEHFLTRVLDGTAVPGPVS